MSDTVNFQLKKPKGRVCANEAQTSCETYPSSTACQTFVEKVLSISRYTSSLSVTAVFSQQSFLWQLHQRAGLTLSRHHDSNSSHACQSGGADLWGHSERRRWHLRLSLLSPVGDGDYGAPEKLRRGPVWTRRPLVFAWRCASDVVTRKPL